MNSASEQLVTEAVEEVVINTTLVNLLNVGPRVVDRPSTSGGVQKGPLNRDAMDVRLMSLAVVFT
jgi:hypothetical protein